ncbi:MULTISPECIES: GNAT family N-acetyltransferase [unclassified Clostridium]|uniref:GNAT family N-acetyltransferase n=1 Tax=unclassified Clostridium TaxID=2614128 RepID=UPI000EE4421A|nr:MULTISPECIES: GNAT family N-acetyltransferase [unclassified Clostridium]HCQ89041.1 N-acetyltransferase [Clostridium sp.]
MEDFNIRFREMSDDEFDKFAEGDILAYSKDLIKSGLSSEENALENAKKSFNELLPQGKYTKDNYIYVVVNSDNEGVGFIWYQKYKEDIAFICDFLILEKFRKQGYGKQTLLLLEKEAKEKGLNKILLNVFKYNKPAFSLYKSLEYKIRDQKNENISMLKNI